MTEAQLVPETISSVQVSAPARRLIGWSSFRVGSFHRAYRGCPSYTCVFTTSLIPLGPITSVVKEVERGTLPYGRYTEVRTPDGKRYPVCFLLGNPDGVPQYEESQPGAVVLPRSLPFFAVKRFVFE